MIDCACHETWVDEASGDADEVERLFPNQISKHIDDLVVKTVVAQSRLLSGGRVCDGEGTTSRKRGWAISIRNLLVSGGFDYLLMKRGDFLVWAFDSGPRLETGFGTADFSSLFPDHSPMRGIDEIMATTMMICFLGDEPVIIPNRRTFYT